MCRPNPQTIFQVWKSKFLHPIWNRTEEANIACLEWCPDGHYCTSCSIIEINSIVVHRFGAKGKGKEGKRKMEEGFVPPLPFFRILESPSSPFPLAFATQAIILGPVVQSLISVNPGLILNETYRVNPGLALIGLWTTGPSWTTTSYTSLPLSSHLYPNQNKSFFQIIRPAAISNTDPKLAFIN